MISLTEFELKIILSIQDSIDHFEVNKIDLYGLINALEGGANMLESVSAPWKDSFQAEINTLEMIHDSIEDGSISRWKGSYKEDLYTAVRKLKKLSVSLIEEYLERSDSNVLESALEADSNWFICPKCNDAWKSSSLQSMVICIKCHSPLHNPRIVKNK
jgi:hypothetical protein